MKLEIFKTLKIHIVVFWIVTPRRLVSGYQCCEVTSILVRGAMLVVIYQAPNTFQKATM
jgi:hypothetical protein